MTEQVHRIRVAGLVRYVTGMRWEEANAVANALLSQFEITVRDEPIPIRWDWQTPSERPVLTLVPKEVQS